MTNEEIIAGRIVGAPFAECGRTLDGMDCLGVVIHFYREAYGFELPDPLSEDRETVLDHPLAEMFHEVERRDAVTGDVVEFEGGRHLGILIGRRVLQPSHREQGVCLIPRGMCAIEAYYRHNQRL